MFGEGAREGEAVLRQSSEPARPAGSTGRILRPQAAFAVPEPPRETVERSRKVATVCAEGEAEPLRRHFLLWLGAKIGELNHPAQFLVARAGEESAYRLGEQRPPLGRSGRRKSRNASLSAAPKSGAASAGGGAGSAGGWDATTSVAVDVSIPPGPPAMSRPSQSRLRCAR